MARDVGKAPVIEELETDNIWGVVQLLMESRMGKGSSGRSSISTIVKELSPRKNLYGIVVNRFQLITRRVR